MFTFSSEGPGSGWKPRRGCEAGEGGARGPCELTTFEAEASAVLMSAAGSGWGGGVTVEGA